MPEQIIHLSVHDLIQMLQIILLATIGIIVVLGIHQSNKSHEEPDRSRIEYPLNNCGPQQAPPKSGY